MSKHHHNEPASSGKSTANHRKAKIFQRYCMLPLCLLAVACGGTAGYRGELYDVDDFYGGIVGDEPRAVLVGRNIMDAGGNAADAVVAAYFVMSVTMPSSAGLGGGGVCVVHRGEDEDERVTEVIDFLPRGAAGGRVAIPGNARGMAALSARYGKLPWAQVVSPSETLANQGTSVSRALGADVKRADQKIRSDADMSALFLRADGSLINEGDNLLQPELGSLLAQLRARGSGELYGGLAGQQLAEAAQSLGAPLTIEDLRNAQVKFYPPLEYQLGEQTVYMPAPPSAGGVTTIQMLEVLGNAGGDRSVMLADASMRLAADRGQWMQAGGDTLQPVADLISDQHVDQVMNGPRPSAPVVRPENPFATGLVAVDRDGLAVACAFTMNALFGAGRIAPGTGVILAPAPDERGFGFSAISPLIMANRHNGEFYYASAASGGLPAAIAQADVLDGVARKGLTLEKAMLRSRVYNNGDPDVAFYDVSGNDNPEAVLQAAGMTTEQHTNLGRVNAIYCPGGAPSDPESCQLRNDFRGNGLASLVTKD